MKIVITLCFIFSLSYATPSYAVSNVFSRDTLANVVTAHKGEKWLLLVWSLDCPPCFKELALVGELSKKQRVNVVLVNADDDDGLAEERTKIINQYQLHTLVNFHFADGEGERSRYLLDKNWYGELPRSYFIDENGQFHGRSGLVNEELLRKWLIN